MPFYWSPVIIFTIKISDEYAINSEVFYVITVKVALAIPLYLILYIQTKCVDNWFSDIR